MAVKTITSGNVEFGACQVTFGVTDLGAFKGGVTTNYTYTKVESKPDSLSAANQAFVTEESMIITIPLLEVDLTTFNSLGLTDRKQISNFDFEVSRNDDNRRIKLIDKDFISSILSGVEEIFG